LAATAEASITVFANKGDMPSMAMREPAHTGLPTAPQQKPRPFGQGFAFHNVVKF